MLILTPYATFPRDGEVIICANGHEVAQVAENGGHTIFATDYQLWPDLLRLDGGVHPEGMELPICCNHCGAVAIDWDRRFMGGQAHDLTQERVQAVLDGGESL